MAGAVTVRPVPVTAVSSHRKRWSIALAWVTAPSRSRLTRSTGTAADTCTVKSVPRVTAAGAATISGRGPANRYGGENSWALACESCGSFGTSLPCASLTWNSPPPALNTRPSGSSRVVAW